MRKTIAIFSIIFFGLGFSACETEFSLNGDYRLTPVVFGLMDDSDSLHMIKITKAFLGDGSNLVYAQNPDSNYFEQVDAIITEFDLEGDETGRSWQLRDTVIPNKSTDGVFYSPEQKVYYFEAHDLNSDYSYQLDADFNEGQANITSVTGLVKNFSAPSKYDAGLLKLSFAINTVDEDKDYKVVRVSFNAGTNVGLYEYGYTFNWTEFYLDGTSEEFSLYQRVGTEGDVGTDALYSGIDFYRWVQNNIPDDPNVSYRIATGFDMHISVAHNTFAQYLSVSQPVSGIAQIQPVFTNIEGGFGLFSSRKLYIKKGLQLDAPSTKELANGQFTITKNFCSPLSEHNDAPYACE